MSDPLQSMTGFGRADGEAAGLRWSWELRSVNGRGLDVRLRLPTGFEAAEPALRQAVQQAMRRGTLAATLQVRRNDPVRQQTDPAALDAMIALALEVAARIPNAPPPRAEALLALPGVLRATGPAEADAVSAAQIDAICAGFGTALAALVAARREEGARLHDILDQQLRNIAALHAEAAQEASEQPALQQARLRDSLRALLQNTPALPEERIAQEIALLATRSDVREELDRLQSHLQAARDLLTGGTPVGRRFDFLVQEFMREANTLCSKSGSTTLTTIGLTLKATIEQMREQVQNIE